MNRRGERASLTNRISSVGVWKSSKFKITAEDFPCG